MSFRTIVCRVKRFDVYVHVYIMVLRVTKYIPFLFKARQSNLFTYTMQIHKYINIKRKEMPCRYIIVCKILY